MPGAFRHGIVKNHQGSAPELLQIKARERTELLNSQHSRDKASSKNFSRAARLAAASPPGALRALIRLRRIAKRAFYTGTVKILQHPAPHPCKTINPKNIYFYFVAAGAYSLAKVGASLGGSTS
jgi:hypothetical protein